MTVTTETASITHTGNGVTSVFSVPFKFLESGHLQVSSIVVATGVATILGAGEYTVAGAGDPNGGTVTYLPSGTPIGNTKQLLIERIVPYTQDLSLNRQGGFYPDAIENQLDLLAMQVQQLKSMLDEAVSGGTITAITRGVAGPASTTVDQFALWNNTTGTLLKSQYTAASFATAAHSHSFASLTGKPTTIAGYGITDLDEEAVDAVAAAFLGGSHTNITVTYDDTSGTISLISSDENWSVKERDANSLITTNTSLASDTLLQFTMSPNTTYVVEASLFLLSPNGVGFKMGITGPASPTKIQSFYQEVDSADATDVDWLDAYGTHKTNTPGADTTVHVKLNTRIENGANSGAFALQFAQNVSSATATVVYAGSYLRYKEV